MDKPLEWTSFDVANKLRAHLKYHYDIPKMKVGHAGTLDPLATGLLLVCVGIKTRSISLLQEMKKTYTGTFRLGATTPSFDAETQISEVMPWEHITQKMITQAANSFVGEIMQEPPLYSAIKLGGKRAYDMARSQKEVVLMPRPVTIYEFEITGVENQEVEFIITCSKGTYIRSVARDFGRILGSCAYLTSLRRTHIGEYNVENAFTIHNYDEAFRDLM